MNPFIFPKLSWFLPCPFGVLLRRPRRDRETGDLVSPLSRSPRALLFHRLVWVVDLAARFINSTSWLWALRQDGVRIELEFPAARVVGELRSKIRGAWGVSPTDVFHGVSIPVFASGGYCGSSKPVCNGAPPDLRWPGRLL
jgi:hypothetical protein